MPRVKLSVETEIDLDIDTAAKWFAALDDDQQCKFFVAVAREFEGLPAHNQWYYVGGHLKSCECSTEQARAMIRDIAYWMEHSEHN